MRCSDPWFVASDACDCLALSNVSKALADLDDDDKLKLTKDELDTLTSSEGIKCSVEARVVMRCAEPWFVAKDVATCIEHSNVTKMCELCRDKDIAIVNGKEYSNDLLEYSEGRGSLVTPFSVWRTR